ncbi:MAG: chemotaxis protein CheA [Rubrivivax sp.]|nr:chemotaxis protein CheA [Rubrivivax sp.]
MNRDDDAEILAAARAGFLDEASDMLAQFEQALLVMETAPDDAENLNAAFRAAHTIKGTAGMFGCEAVVTFTHEVETLLESLRAGKLDITEEIAAALLEGRDQMEALIAEVRMGTTSPQVQARSAELGQVIRRLYGGSPVDADAAPAAAVADAPGAPAAVASTAGAWHLSLRFGPDALRDGMDPLAFLRYLRTIGEVWHVQTLTESVPALEQMEPEACYLGFELRLKSERTRQEIESVFEFAREVASIEILDPGARPIDFDNLLDKRCGDDEAARSRLLWIWLSQGVDIRLREEPPVPPEVAHLVPAVTTSVPKIERRTENRERRGPARERRAAEETRFVKVRADKLDHLIDLIGELVIAGSGAQMVANHEGSPAFLEATQRVADLVQATRDGALALRMVPVGETFARFQRVVRDTGKQLGKAIEFSVTGGDTELDKSMVEVLADPLMHLVRNSLDHGIEQPEERESNGKPRTGHLVLNAYHEAGSIVIEVIDDGRGLRRERILGKAIERGLISPEAQLSDPEVWQLIFAPGFSTADQVTDLSGRGVGMDVVRRNIESLRGQISLSSIEGQGTTTQIRLPLTLAMIDGFLTMVGSVYYVLPLAVVAECIDVPRECRDAPERTCGTFDLRGEVLPYLDLARFYGSETGDARRRSLIVVRDGSVRIGLVVDRLLGEHQTVIKPLAGIFRHLKALAGSTILGSGDVALVLDMQGLVAAATQAGAAISR